MSQPLLRVLGCLRCKEVPNVSNIYIDYEKEYTRCTKRYLQRGGTVQAVIQGLFEFIMYQNEENGDRTFFEVSDFRTQHDSLPSCRNDGEWGFVRGMLIETDT